MTLLIAGLLLFLAPHSVRMVAPDLRTAGIARLGPLGWKAAFAAVSALGLLLIVLGYGDARSAPTLLWAAPAWTRHLAALLTLPAFILIAAAYIPGTVLRARIGHPMVAGVKAWAFAHLLANGTLADLLLFGSLLLWAGANFAISRRRDRIAGVTYSAAGPARDAVAVVIGLVAWFVFARYLHGALIGVQPFG